MTGPVFIDAPGGGAIGLMPCPGRDGSLEETAAMIAQLGVSIVVSLIESKESRDVIERLPVLLAARQIGWRHWPVVDYNIPDQTGESTWPAIADELQRSLDDGKRVLVHCWGGRGRSGMVALRLLTERGEPADEALVRLRAVRPRAVETGPQLAWAQAGRLRMGPIADQISAMNESSPFDGHGAKLTIDLSALQANWRLLAERARPAECAGVVKADAYGIGIERAVPALLKAGCRTFFVAHLSEARRLRAVAPDVTLYILNGLPKSHADAYKTLNARPVLGSLEELAEWRQVGEGAPFALHVDTGLNRLGLTLAEFRQFVPDGFSNVFRPSLVLSHFVSSEDPADPITDRQIAAFATVSAALPGVDASLSNSSGFFLPEPPRYQLMRPGYALYGGNPTPGEPNPMQAVVRLEAQIMQVREVQAGDTVGYNTKWTAKRPTTIATLSLGYADGWFRLHSGTDEKPGGVALIRGLPCPIAGRVSMDLITIDVTDLPEGSVKRGETAVLLGDGLGVDEVAARAGTNGYEVLTDLGRRYERTYIGG